MFLHLCRVFFWESFLHHLAEIFGQQFPIGMVSNEGVESLPDLVFSKATGLRERRNVLLPQHWCPALVAHSKASVVLYSRGSMGWQWRWQVKYKY